MKLWQPDVGLLVAETPFPVIPCYLQGTFEAFPPKARFPLPKRIRVQIGQPRLFHESTNRTKQWEEIAQLLESDIREMATRAATTAKQ